MAVNWASSIHTLSRKLRKSLAQRGVAATAQRFVTKPLEIARMCVREMSAAHRRCRREETEFDRQMHVETGASADPGWLAKISSANWMHGVGYTPVPMCYGTSILAGLDICFEDYVFIDVGAGKGRMLFLASEFPFRRIIGVEYSPDLHATLEQNLHTYRNPAQRCGDLQGVLQDATQFDLPLVPLVLFFHHPFDEPVFRQVVARIERSLDETPREILVVYFDPICGDLFERSRHFQRLQHGEHDRNIRYASSWTVYGSRDSATKIQDHALPPI